MALLNLVSANKWLMKLSSNKLNQRQISRSIAYLRAKKIVFYDDWSNEHVLILEELMNNKIEVINSLKIGINTTI